MRLLIPILAVIGGGAVVVVTYFQLAWRNAEPQGKAYLAMKPPPDLPPRLHSLVRRLGSNDASERAQAAIELRKMGIANHLAMPYLARLLEDRTPVRIESGTTPDGGIGFFTCPGALAAAALGDSDEASVGALVRAMTKTRNEDIRRSALEGAGWCNDPNATRALAAALESDQVPIREAAQVGLKRAGVRAVDALDQCLHGQNGAARTTAAEILAALADPTSLQVLLHAAADINPEVRAAAEYGLSRITSAGHIPVLVEHLSDPTVREPAIHVLRQLDHPQRTWLLVDALQSRSNSNLRSGAARALTVLKDPAAADALRKAQSDPDAEVRHQAGEALVALQTTRQGE